jgi:hypothetical protein
MKRHLAALLMATLACSPAVCKESKTPWIHWFQRAADQMNLRAYGSAPFHMKVVFHAFPGVVLSDKKSDQIISGGGTYEETWVAPTQWRREVTFGSYHAVEVESQAGRKMQASSAYEPSRVLMLLEALLYPVPRQWYSPSLADEHPGWKIENGSVGGQSYVKISGSDVPKILLNTPQNVPRLHAYLFLPGGELMQSIEIGVVTDWTQPMTFSGKLVPQHIRIQSGFQQDLLTADVKIEPAGEISTTAFTLPGDNAEPAMTVRPLHKYEVNGLHGMWLGSFVSHAGENIDGAWRFIIARDGTVREVELLYSSASGPSAAILTQLRKYSGSAPTIDKSPCEIALSPVR